MEPAYHSETVERGHTLIKALTWIAAIVALTLAVSGMLPSLLFLCKLSTYLWVLAIIAVIVAARFWAGLPLEQRYEAAPSDELRKKLGWAWILALVGAVSLLNIVGWFQNEIGFARLVITLFELLALGLAWGALRWILQDAIEAEASGS